MKLLTAKKLTKVRIERASAPRQERKPAHCHHFSHCHYVRHCHHFQPNA